jgi:DNA-binding LytR/AlgR family response regulator
MKVLIIEDEHLAADKLSRMLYELDPDIQILALLESVSESADWLSSNPAPDLIFMDIQLDDGISFEIFDSVKISTPVIFTTAYNEYAIKAFKVNSVDYLLKPYTTKDLKLAINKYKELHEGQHFQSEKFDHLYRQLVKEYKTRFFVKIGTHFHSISVDEIACFFIRDRATFIKTLIGKNFDIDYSLDQVQKLIDPARFFRINRNYAINIDSIADIISYSSNRLKVVLKNFEHLDDLLVSREKTSDFKKWLDR